METLERKAHNLLIAIENEINSLHYTMAAKILQNMIEAEYKRGYEDGRSHRPNQP